MAAHLGCTVRELLWRIDSRELSEWMAFEMLEGPIGAKRDDLLAAMIRAEIANANRSRGKPYPVSKFVPEWDQTPKTDDELLAKLKRIHAALGGDTTQG